MGKKKGAAGKGVLTSRKKSRQITLGKKRTRALSKGKKPVPSKSWAVKGRRTVREARMKDLE